MKLINKKINRIFYIKLLFILLLSVSIFSIFKMSSVYEPFSFKKMTSSI